MALIKRITTSRFDRVAIINVKINPDNLAFVVKNGFHFDHMAIALG